MYVAKLGYFPNEGRKKETRKDITYMKYSILQKNVCLWSAFFNAHMHLYQLLILSKKSHYSFNPTPWSVISTIRMHFYT